MVCAQCEKPAATENPLYPTDKRNRFLHLRCGGHPSNYLGCLSNDELDRIEDPERCKKCDSVMRSKRYSAGYYYTCNCGYWAWRPFAP